MPSTKCKAHKKALTRCRSLPPEDDPDEADSESDPPAPSPPRRVAPPRAAGGGAGSASPTAGERSSRRAGVPGFSRHASSPARLFGAVGEAQGARSEGLGVEGDEVGRRLGGLLPPPGQAAGLECASPSGIFDTGSLTDIHAPDPSGLALGLEQMVPALGPGHDEGWSRRTSRASFVPGHTLSSPTSTIDLIPTPSAQPASPAPGLPMSSPMIRAAYSPYSVYSVSLWNSTTPQYHSASPSLPVASSSFTHPARLALSSDSRRHSSALTCTASFSSFTVTPSPSPAPLLYGGQEGFTFPPAGVSRITLPTPATRGLAASLSAHESCLQGGGRRRSLPDSPGHSKASSVSSTLSDTLTSLGSSLGLHHAHAPESPGRPGRVFSAVSQATKSTLDYAIAAIHSSPPARSRERALLPGLAALPGYAELAGVPGWADVAKITVQLRATDPSPDNAAAAAFLDWLMDGKDQHWGAAQALAQAGGSGLARRPLTPRQSMQDVAVSSTGAPLRGVGKGMAGEGLGVGPKVEFAAGKPLVVVESARWCARFAPEGRGPVEILRHILAGPD